MVDIVIALLQLEIRDYNKLPPKLRQYVKKIYEIGATGPWTTGVSALAGNSG